MAHTWHRIRGAALVLALLLAVAPQAPARAASPDWVDVDYSALVDRRELSHSGESVGVLLEQLGGRPAPANATDAPGDHLAHSLLEPLIERYAFVLSDALDRISAAPARPLVEVGALWQPGEAQPAWAELLRARRYLVESDGAGRLRIAVPTRREGPPDSRAPEADPTEVAQEAWDDAWPVLRHVLAAERRRVGGEGALDVEVHAYRHAPARSLFRLGTRPFRTKVTDTRSRGVRPPLDLAAWQGFLDSGLRLEGGRLEEDGGVTLLGSRQPSPPTLLGQPLSLADLAVAYRAVVHGGLAEPYMSLDRGYSPQTSIVNYGGRLRDTGLGLVSLLCDIRFKTFSLGLDIVEGTDVRARLREALPTFRSHMERFAEHPDSLTVTSQQTRLWFYPDRVDLTVSGQGDVVLLRRVRMSAASERVGKGADAGSDPPWTLATVEAIDRDYDRLAAFFPELADLDQVVRLLSLFTWLEQATRNGLLTPDLDALLALELPALTTPRTYPQLLAFNALPAPGSGGKAEVFDRVPVAEAIERLNPAGGRPVSAQVRFRRAIAALDPRDSDVARLLAEIGDVNPDTLDETTLDLLSHRAERLRMHLTVLAALGPDETRRVTSRQQAGESLRIFSVAIGGLDLGMGKALERARGQSLSIAGGAGAGSATERVGSAAVGDPREEWRTEVARLPPTVLPDHGAGAADDAAGRARVGPQPGGAGAWSFWLAGENSPDVISRKTLRSADGAAARFERLEGPRALSYILEAMNSGWKATSTARAPEPAAPGDPEGLPPGLVTLAVGPPAEGAAGEPGLSAKIGLRLVAAPDGTPRNLDADFPRSLLQRLVVGRSADLTPGKPLPALGTLPASLGAVEALMTLLGPAQREAPWDRAPAAIPGEEDPVRLARALGEWWSTRPTGAESASAVVGTDPSASPRRWAAAPRVTGNALLVLPADAFPGSTAELRKRLARVWPESMIVERLPQQTDATLVVVVSGESPGVFAERLTGLAAHPALSGKLLGAWCLSGDMRQDLPARLLAAHPLAGLGLAEASVVDLRHAADRLAAMSRSLLEKRAPRRVETLGGPFLWYF